MVSSSLNVNSLYIAVMVSSSLNVNSLYIAGSNPRPLFGSPVETVVQVDPATLLQLGLQVELLFLYSDDMFGKSSRHLGSSCTLERSSSSTCHFWIAIVLTPFSVPLLVAVAIPTVIDFCPSLILRTLLSIGQYFRGQS
jgi:hypothetical protein